MLRVLEHPTKRYPRPERVANGFDYPTVMIGRSTHVTLQLATVLGARGFMLAKAVLAQMEAVFQQVQALFGTTVSLPPVVLLIAPLSPASDGTGGAYHYGCTGTDLYADACFANPARTLALFAAELSEVGQALQNRGWDCGNTNGEGLSRVHAETLFPGVLDDYSTAGAWLDGGRPNWVDNQQGTDGNTLSNGCAVLFINWLIFKGMDLLSITQQGCDTLAGLYTAFSQPSGQAWPDFLRACARWPTSQSSNVTTDNPWGNAPTAPASAATIRAFGLDFPHDVKKGDPINIQGIAPNDFPAGKYSTIKDKASLGPVELLP